MKRNAKIFITIMLLVVICVAILVTSVFKSPPLNIEFNCVGNWESVSFAQQRENYILLSLEKERFPLLPYAEALYLFDIEEQKLTKVKNGNHTNLQCSGEKIYYQKTIQGQLLRGIYCYDLYSGEIKRFLSDIYVESFFVQEKKIIYTTGKELRIFDLDIAKEITISENAQYFYLPETDMIWFQTGTKLLSYDIGENEYETLFDFDGRFLKTIQNTNEILCFLREYEGRYDFCIFDKQDLSIDILFSAEELVIDARMTEDNSIIFWNGEQLNKLDQFQKISTIGIFDAEVALLKNCFCVRDSLSMSVNCYDYKGNLLYAVWD